MRVVCSGWISGRSGTVSLCLPKIFGLLALPFDVIRVSVLICHAVVFFFFVFSQFHCCISNVMQAFKGTRNTFNFFIRLSKISGVGWTSSRSTAMAINGSFLMHYSHFALVFLQHTC